MTTTQLIQENAGEPNEPRSGKTPSRAVRIHAFGGPEVVGIDAVESVAPGPGEVLVGVKAAGVNGLDWKVREGFVRNVYPLALPATLGIELAGEVLQTGEGVTALKPGDRVMGPLGGLGAYADRVVATADRLSLIPSGLSHVEAAAIPVAGLTASQVLQAPSLDLKERRVLVHGAAGAVGGFLMQLAKSAGATVFATASGRSAEHVRRLGADEVVDYRTERFEDRLRDLDLVVDLIGGDVVDRSWSTLSPTGVLISTAAPDLAQRTPPGRRGVWLMMRPDAERLREIAERVVAGDLVSTIAEVVGVADLPAAIERNRTGHAPGKIVVDFTR